MADQSDVEVALVNVISAALYPSGTGSASVPGPDCRIYRGWPNSAALDADLAADKINVTVFPGGGMSRTTTRYAEHWMGAPTQPALTVAVNGTSVTFGGAADVGEIAGILVDGKGYAYRTQVGDTPQLVAANLASMARNNSIVQLSHCTLTIAGAGNLVARVVADAQVQQEVRRQEQSFRVTCWCPTPAARDATAGAIDQSLSSQHFLTLHGWYQRPAELRGNHCIRSIAEREIISARPFLPRGIRDDSLERRSPRCCSVISF